MSRLHRMLARVRHRVVLAHYLARARREVRRLGLWVPSGIWFCDRCGLVVWDLDAFVGHVRAHAA